MAFKLAGGFDKRFVATQNKGSHHESSCLRGPHVAASRSDVAIIHERNCCSACSWWYTATLLDKGLLRLPDLLWRRSFAIATSTPCAALDNMLDAQTVESAMRNPQLEHQKKTLELQLKHDSMPLTACHQSSVENSGKCPHPTTNKSFDMRTPVPICPSLHQVNVQSQPWPAGHAGEHALPERLTHANAGNSYDGGHSTNGKLHPAYCKRYYANLSPQFELLSATSGCLHISVAYYGYSMYACTRK